MAIFGQDVKPSETFREQGAPRQTDFYTQRLNYLQDTARDFYEKYGKKTYDRYTKYLTFRSEAEQSGVDINAFSPNYAKIDDLIENEGAYREEYGDIGYDQLYSMTYNLVKPEIETVYDAMNMKGAGLYSADILDAAPTLRDKYVYTDDPEDQMRQQLGYVPIAFDAGAKQIVKQAQELKKAEAAAKQTASDAADAVADETTGATTFTWDDLDTANAPITEEQLREAIQYLETQTSEGQAAAKAAIEQAALQGFQGSGIDALKSPEEQAASLQGSGIEAVQAKKDLYAAVESAASISGDDKVNKDATMALVEGLNLATTEGQAKYDEIMAAQQEKLQGASNYELFTALPENAQYLDSFISSLTPDEMNEILKESGKSQAEIYDEYLGKYSGTDTFNINTGHKGDEAKAQLEADDEAYNNAYMDAVKQAVYEYILAADKELSETAEGRSPAGQITLGGIESGTVGFGDTLENLADSVFGGLAELLGLTGGAATGTSQDAIKSRREALTELIQRNHDVLSRTEGYRPWHDNAMNVVQSAVQTGLSMTLGAGVGAATSTGGQMLGQAQSLVNTIAPNAITKGIFVSSYGDNVGKYTEMGFSPVQVAVYSLAEAAATAKIESLGGIGAANPSRLGKAFTALLTPIEELGEEAAQGVTSAIFESVASGTPLEENENLLQLTTPEGLAEIAASVTLMSLLFGAGNLGVNVVNAQKAAVTGDVQATANALIEDINNTGITTENEQALNEIQADLKEYTTATESTSAEGVQTQGESGTDVLTADGGAQTATHQTAQSLSEVYKDTEYGDMLAEKLDNGEYDYNVQSNTEKLQRSLDAIESGKLTTENYDSVIDPTSGALKTYTTQDVSNILMLHEDAVNRNDEAAIDDMESALIDALSQSGRTLQMAGYVYKISPKAHLTAMQREIQRMNVKGQENFGNKWNEVTLTKEEEQAILNASDYESRRTAYKEALDRIGKELPSTAWEKYDQIRKTAMLGNIRTNVRNIGGNAMMKVTEAVMNKVRAALELTLPQDQRTTPFSLTQEYKDAAKGTWENGGKAAFDGAQKYELNQDGKSKYALKDEGLGKIMNKYTEITGKMLEWGDLWFAKPAYETALARFMQARGLSKPNATAHEFALQEALEATYRDHSKFASWLAKGGKVVSIVQPFVKTPTNIARRAFDYSEFGLLKTLIVDSVRLKRGKITANQYIKNLSRGLTGTAVLSGLGYALGAGVVPGLVLTGGWSDNEKEKELQKLDGFRPYSLKIGDTYIPLSWAQPIMTPIMSGAEIGRAVKEHSSFWEAVNPVTAASALLDGLGDLTVFSGLQQIIGYSGTATEAAKNILISAVSQAIPTPLKQLAKTIDPNYYEVYNGEFWERLSQQTITSLPGVKGLLEGIGVDADIAPTVDPFGNTRQRQGNTIWRGVLNFVSPADVTTASDDPIVDEITRLSEEIRETRTDLNPRDVLPRDFDDRTIKDVEISEKELAQLKIDAGTAVYRVLGTYINSSAYNSDDLDTRYKNIKKIYDKIWTAYKDELLAKKG